MDTALEHRIHVAPPTPSVSGQIWQKLIPLALPLSDQPNFSQLSAAACRGGDAAIEIRDLSAAAQVEVG